MSARPARTPSPMATPSHPPTAPQPSSHPRPPRSPLPAVPPTKEQHALPRRPDHRSNGSRRDHGKPEEKRYQSRFERSGGEQNRKDDPKSIGPWRVGRTIGKGSSGRVKIARHSRTGQYAAVKIVPKHLLASSRLSMSEATAKAEKMLLGIEREVVIMKLISHPSVLSLYDVWETERELFLILEYVEGGELFDYLVQRGRLRQDEALRYFQQVIAGVDYCHRFNIAHRDLKPENLLLDKHKNIKIADFGMAALQPGGRMLETSCGSPHYASPEIVAGKHYDGSCSDIWSCGVILFALLTGRLPFDDENIRTLLQKVKLGHFVMPSELDPEAQHLIRRMLCVDPTQRAKMDEIIAHPWFNRRKYKPWGNSTGPKEDEDPTSLEALEEELKERADIDQDILDNLATLWHGTPKKEIEAALLSKEKNQEKAFYSLLIRYRTRQLETYNMADSDLSPALSRHQSSSSPRTPNWSNSDKEEIGLKRRTSTRAPPVEQQASTKSAERPDVETLKVQKRPAPPAPVAENSGSSPTRPLAIRPKSPIKTVETPSCSQPSSPARTPMARPGNPSPGRAEGDGDHETPTRPRRLPVPGSTETGTPGHVARIARRFAETRAETPNHRASVVPAITFQAATPEEMAARKREEQRQKREDARSPITPTFHAQDSPRLPSPALSSEEQFSGTSAPSSALISPVTPQQALPSPALSQASDTSSGSTTSGSRVSAPSVGGNSLGITVPQVNDEVLQKFFNDVAEQLIALRSGASSSSVGASSTAASGSDFTSPASLFDQAMSAVKAASMAASSTSEPAAVKNEGVGGTAIPKAEPAVTPAAPAPTRDYRAEDKENSAAAKPGMRSNENLDEGRQKAALGVNLRAQNGRPSGPRTSYHEKTDKNRAQVHPPVVPVAGLPVAYTPPNKDKEEKGYQARLRRKNPDGLGLDMKAASPTALASPVFNSSSSPRSEPSAPPTPFLSPGLGAFAGGGIGGPHTPTASTPKHSWFANLFHWKPASYSLLSSESVPATRAEAYRILEGFGISVIVEDADGAGVLKCRVEEIREPLGGAVAIKSVRFRVEFSARGGPSGSGGGGGTSPKPMSPSIGSETGSSVGGGSRVSTYSTASSASGGGAHASALAAGFQTSLTLVQEKGALSSFKTVYNRMRKEWELDTPRSPAIGLGVRMVPSPIVSPQL